MMRKVLIIAAIILCGGFTTMYGQEARMEQMPAEQKMAEITFDEMEHEMGTFILRGKSDSHDFRFTNTGNAPLVILRSEVTCSCLSVTLPKKPIAPGESGVITVKYTPKNEIGHFHNGIKIYSNATDRRVILFVSGDVVKK